MTQAPCKKYFAAIALVLPLAFAGCANLNHTQNGALVGSGFGGVMGGLIGHATGNTGAGALIGATSGGLIGALAGNAEDVREQQAADYAQAHYAEQQANALTNMDLIRMTHAQVGDDVIIQAVRSRGGRFDLSVDGLIALRNAGVSEKVLVEVQKLGGAAPTTTVVPATKYVVAPSPQVVVVRPRPAVRFGVVVGPGRPRYRWRHRHRW